MTAPLPLVLPVDNASPEPTAAEQRVWPLPAPGRSEERAEIERRRLVLAIESSCDETAVAIIDADGNMLANQVSTQIDFHARFGGVVPDRLAQTRRGDCECRGCGARGCRSIAWS